MHANWSCSGDGRNIVPDANLRVVGSQVKYRGLLIRSIDIDGRLLQRKLDLPTCKVVFNNDNFIDAKGNALIQDPYNYEADATVATDTAGEQVFVKGVFDNFSSEARERIG